MPKFYFAEGDASCYTKQYHLEQMQLNDIAEMQVFEAKIERGTGMFYCNNYSEIGETGNCGKDCNAYEPRNGKNGICKHFRNPYEITNKKVILKTTISND